MKKQQEYSSHQSHLFNKGLIKVCIDYSTLIITKKKHDHVFYMLLALTHCPFWNKRQLAYISAMTGSIGALNLLDCLHVVRQPEARTRKTICLSACLLAENPPSVCFASSAFSSEPVSLSSADFLLYTMGTCLLRGSFRQISAPFGPWFPSDLKTEGCCGDQENCHPVCFPSSMHPLRASRAAVRMESVWLCSSFRGSERSPDMVDVLPRSGVTVCGLLLPSISLISRVRDTYYHVNTEKQGRTLFFKWITFDISGFFLLKNNQSSWQNTPRVVGNCTWW